MVKTQAQSKNLSTFQQPVCVSFLFFSSSLAKTVCFLCVSGFHRNEDMKAIDVLPILKEKVAFLSGQIPKVKH